MRLSSLARKRPRPLIRESLLFLAFVALTALMTWPWVLFLRDAVADPGDPYMISWSLWWDYHQTFNDPLRLFHGNVFYPYRYTLAFSENDYGIALLFFPLFALGVRPLTINSLATFLGFAFCGYAAFRLTRTLTGSTGAAWVGGIVFAFIPYRFNLLSHLHYLFAGWIPLLAEALVLYARERSWRRAVWLGTAFLMNALSCITWFIMTLVPLGLTCAYLLARRPELARERVFWVRGGAMLGLASLLLLPFLLPYHWVSKMYGLRWEEWEFAKNSPTLMSWLSAERRTRIWETLGDNVAGAHKLFPGLAAPLLALAALRLGLPLKDGASEPAGPVWRRRAARALEGSIVLALVLAVIGVGFEDVSFRLFGLQILRVGTKTGGHALVFVTLALVARLALGLWSGGATATRADGAAARARAALTGLLREGWRTEAVMIGLIWLVWGFLSSLGANFFLNRWLREYVLLFQSLRIPARWAMICYVGLAVLAGFGACALARRLAAGRGRNYRVVVVAIICAVLIFELRAFPLELSRGAVDPDAVTLRLKETPMRGGLVELPSAEGLLRHRYMLRAADHGRPLVNGHASFVSPLTEEIGAATSRGPITSRFMALLERIPASYLVIHNADVPDERRATYENFLARAVASGRLRFINRFDGRDDLYAVTAVEPEAKQEAPLPFDVAEREWAALIEADPVNLLGGHSEWSQRLFRLYVAAKGRMPRREEFVPMAVRLGRGVVLGFDENETRLRENFRMLADELAGPAKAPAASSRSAKASVAERAGDVAGLDDEAFVEQLLANVGLSAEEGERDALVSVLATGQDTRGGILARLADEARFAARERNRALVVLHFFAYLRRNPDDPPDRNLNGMLHWTNLLERGFPPESLTPAFELSFEYEAIKKKKN
jgi:hypothetical protein